MILQRSLRKAAAIAAMLALALQALWPLFAQAAPRERSELVPLCTVDGVTHFLELKLGRTPLEQQAARHGEHCTLCVFGADRPAAAPPVRIGVLVAVAGESRPVDPGLPPAAPLCNHPPAQPRAPPVVS